MIKMAKKLVAFKTLCQEDQIALLKGSCTELMILRSIMSYDAEKQCWKVCNNYLVAVVKNSIKGNVSRCALRLNSNKKDNLIEGNLVAFRYWFIWMNRLILQFFKTNIYIRTKSYSMLSTIILGSTINTAYLNIFVIYDWWGNLSITFILLPFVWNH